MLSLVVVVVGIFMEAAQAPVDFAQAQDYLLPLELITPLLLVRVALGVQLLIQMVLLVKIHQ